MALQFMAPSGAAAAERRRGECSSFTFASVATAVSAIPHFVCCATINQTLQLFRVCLLNPTLTAAVSRICVPCRLLGAAVDKLVALGATLSSPSSRRLNQLPAVGMQLYAAAGLMSILARLAYCTQLGAPAVPRLASALVLITGPSRLALVSALAAVRWAAREQCVVARGGCFAYTPCGCGWHPVVCLPRSESGLLPEHGALPCRRFCCLCCCCPRCRSCQHRLLNPPL